MTTEQVSKNAYYPAQELGYIETEPVSFACLIYRANAIKATLAELKAKKDNFSVAAYKLLPVDKLNSIINTLFQVYTETDPWNPDSHFGRFERELHDNVFTLGRPLYYHFGGENVHMAQANLTLLVKGFILCLREKLYFLTQKEENSKNLNEEKRTYLNKLKDEFEKVVDSLGEHILTEGRNGEVHHNEPLLLEVIGAFGEAKPEITRQQLEARIAENRREKPKEKPQNGGWQVKTK